MNTSCKIECKSTEAQHRCAASSAPDRRVETIALEQEINRSRHAVLVVNTRSRHGARAYSEAKRRLAEAGMALDAAYPVRDAERLPEIVREEIAKGRKFIIIGGGDGTISSVVDHFAYTSVVFGVLPLGTANSFARTLGIPLDLRAQSMSWSTGRSPTLISARSMTTILLTDRRSECPPLSVGRRRTA